MSIKSSITLNIAAAFATIIMLGLAAFANRMPAEQRDTIHGLFDAHTSFTREVTETEQGYISRTTSDDPQAVRLLQTHVKQMEGRLKDGLMVRGWDPAYVEFVNHYDDIDIRITNIENGISIVATGKTPEAREVARNHAGIISKFINHGWAEHDKTHAAVYANVDTKHGTGEKGPMSCCQSSGEEGACNSGGESSCSAGEHSENGDRKGMSCCQARS